MASTMMEAIAAFSRRTSVIDDESLYLLFCHLQDPGHANGFVRVLACLIGCLLETEPDHMIDLDKEMDVVFMPDSRYRSERYEVLHTVWNISVEADHAPQIVVQPNPRELLDLVTNAAPQARLNEAFGSTPLRQVVHFCRKTTGLALGYDEILHMRALLRKKLFFAGQGMPITSFSIPVSYEDPQQMVRLQGVTQATAEDCEYLQIIAMSSTKEGERFLNSWASSLGGEDLCSKATLKLAATKSARQGLMFLSFLLIMHYFTFDEPEYLFCTDFSLTPETPLSTKRYLQLLESLVPYLDVFNLKREMRDFNIPLKTMNKRTLPDRRTRWERFWVEHPIAKQEDSKKGDSKKGDSKKGDSKKGDSKRGDSKKGDSKKGDSKKGDSKKGDSKKGNSKKGDSKKGDSKKGYRKKEDSSFFELETDYPWQSRLFWSYWVGKCIFW